MSVRRWAAVLTAPLLAAGCSWFGPSERDDWRAKTDMGSAELAVRAMLRDIDPCGFVDAEAIKTKIPGAISYGYTESFDQCSVRLGAFAGDFPSDVSATIGFDLAPENPQTSEGPIDSIDVNGINVGHLLGPTSNRGWCRYVFNLGDVPGAPSRGDVTDLMRRVQVSVVASLSKDPGPGRPVYPCEEAITIASGAARIRSEGLPRRSGSVPVGEDPCSLLADLRGFKSYRPGGVGFGSGLHDCHFSQGAPGDKEAEGVLMKLRPVDSRNHGDEFHAETRDGVALKVRDEGCRVVVRGNTQIVPVYFDPKAGNAADVRLAGIEVRGSPCEANKQVAVAAAKRFG